MAVDDSPGGALDAPRDQDPPPGVLTQPPPLLGAASLQLDRGVGRQLGHQQSGGGGAQRPRDPRGPGARDDDGARLLEDGVTGALTALHRPGLLLDVTQLGLQLGLHHRDGVDGGGGGGGGGGPGGGGLHLHVTRVDYQPRGQVCVHVCN